MLNPPRCLMTILFGAMSGFGFYSVSVPAVRVGAWAMHYVMPESERTVFKTDRIAVADTFADRWLFTYQMARGGRVHISEELCL
jgi:hypothetical protein